MKHCNTTAAYIELLRMKGEWAEFLPECGRCASHEMGNTWFQKGSKLVDVVLIVPETQGMRGFAKRLPEFVFRLQDVLRQYSFKFGLISFGGKGAVHSEPHVVTVNGQHLGDVEDVSNAIEHLKFADRADNETDGFEAISMATRYPFRTGSTKIVLLLTADERIARPGTMSVRRLTKQLKRQDIIFNVIGKYKKLNQRVIGQDYRGKVFYRKNTPIDTQR
ncbi:predicted protein [Nematostella vectensis]|uniref:VWFA domain-containing protein n=1 Tax=Nematostella vectensis TaxID=45351 RepID=A8DW18_NEMVE|nr:predicted protein [Nematostella vectensis]|eukprot:XP_001617691.1 hypothetical protein NEMVEDRAFT_v1g225879 [Nematostella vectensis]